MVRARRPSKQMRILLAEMIERPHTWQHGYDLMKATGLSSGTLYPLLMRMAENGLVEAEWRDPALPGRPARHAYRLSAAGVELATSRAGQAGADGAWSPA